MGSREAAERVLHQYGQPRPKDADIIADACLRCNSIRFAQRVAAERRGAQVRFYVFDNPAGASFHSAEVPAVWGTADVLTVPDGSVNTSEALVHKMQALWTTFAKGEDVGRLMPEWPGVPPRSVKDLSIHAMVLGDQDRVLQIDTSHCAAWEAATDAIGGFSTARMCMNFYS